MVVDSGFCYIFGISKAPWETEDRFSEIYSGQTLLFFSLSFPIYGILFLKTLPPRAFFLFHLMRIESRNNDCFPCSVKPGTSIPGSNSSCSPGLFHGGNAVAAISMV